MARGGNEDCLSWLNICNNFEAESGYRNRFACNNPFRTFFILSLSVDKRTYSMRVSECKEAVSVDKSNTSISTTNGFVHDFNSIKERIDVEKRFASDAHLIAEDVELYSEVIEQYFGITGSIDVTSVFSHKFVSNLLVVG